MSETKSDQNETEGDKRVKIIFSRYSARCRAKKSKFRLHGSFFAYPNFVPHSVFQANGENEVGEGTIRRKEPPIEQTQPTASGIKIRLLKLLGDYFQRGPSLLLGPRRQKAKHGAQNVGSNEIMRRLRRELLSYDCRGADNNKAWHWRVEEVSGLARLFKGGLLVWISARNSQIWMEQTSNTQDGGGRER